MSLYLVKLSILLLWSVPLARTSAVTNRVYEDYTNHPCIRPCTYNTGPMECVYDFYVEYYAAFGKACGDCPGNASDCFRHGCVTSDGNHRVILTVNKQLPGPAIHVCEGDMVIARVTNNLLGSEGTTIHWHGQLQRGYQHMDGTSRITQCDIPASASFEYRFPANTPGSHLWHAHSGAQTAEGIFGALVVRQPPEVEPHLGLYDLDLPEHTMVIMDWMKKPLAEIFAIHYMGRRWTKQTTILVNGRRVEEDFFTSPGTRAERKFLPMTSFTVERGRRYRFRVISNGVNECPIQISIDGHNLTVIASDGEPFEKVEVESLYIHSGERYDFVLSANNDVGNYWIRLQGTEFGCGGAEAYGAAILKYRNASDDYPTNHFSSYEDATRAGKSLNKWNVGESADNVLLTNLRGLATTGDREALRPVPDTRLYLRLVMNLKQTYRMGRAWMNEINDITLKDPPAPPLTQLEDLDEGIFCNEDTVGEDNCGEVYCECVYRRQVGLGDVVELVLVNEGTNFTAVHPFHLHGHNYFVVGMGKLGNSTTLEEVKRLDLANNLTRNLDNPVAKDTVAINDGGYIILRWHATNPGFWLFHCHTSLHILEGMGLVFQVGAASDMPPVPDRFPRCGDWGFVGRDRKPGSNDVTRCTSDTTRTLTDMVMVVVVAILVIQLQRQLR